MQFIETEDYEEGFSEYYEKEILPEQMKMEEERLRRLRLIKKRAVWNVLFFSILFATIYYLNKNFHHEMISFIHDEHKKNIRDLTLFPIVAIGLMLVLLLIDPFMGYAKAIKKNVFIKAAKFFDDTQYKPAKASNSFIREDAAIIPEYYNLVMEDKVTSRIQGVKISFAEVSLYKDLYNTKESSLRVFKGFWVVFYLKRNSDKTETIAVTRLDNSDRKNIKKRKLDRIYLEDSSLNKIFKFYSSDQIKARVILDPGLMNRIVEFYNHIKKRHKVDNIKFSFYRNRVLFAVKCKRNLFEPKPIWHTCIDGDQIKEFLKQIHMIREIAEILKMERKAR